MSCMQNIEFRLYKSYVCRACFWLHFRGDCILPWTSYRGRVRVRLRVRVRIRFRSGIRVRVRVRVRERERVRVKGQG